jgi:hypothetical protein
MNAMQITDIFINGRMTQRAAQELHDECCRKCGMVDPIDIQLEWETRSGISWDCPPEEFDDDDPYVEQLASIVTEFMKERLKG